MNDTEKVQQIVTQLQEDGGMRASVLIAMQSLLQITNQEKRTFDMALQVVREHEQQFSPLIRTWLISIIPTLLNEPQNIAPAYQAISRWQSNPANLPQIIDFLHALSRF